MVRTRRWGLAVSVLVLSCGGTAPGPAGDDAAPLPGVDGAVSPDGGPPLLDATAPPPVDGQPPPPDTSRPPDLGAPALPGAELQFVPAAALPVSSGAFVVETALLWIGRASLEGDRGGDDDRARIENQRLDLAAAPIRFALPGAPPALYSALRLELAPAENGGGGNSGPGRGGGGGGPGPGGGGGRGTAASIVLTGKTTAGIPFTIQDLEDLRLELRAVDGATLGPGTRLTCKVTLDVSQWLAGIAPPATATGPIVIDSQNNRDILQLIEANLMRSTVLTFQAGAP